jgi:hypothetical protein
MAGVNLAAGREAARLLQGKATFQFFEKSKPQTGTLRFR